MKSVLILLIAIALFSCNRQTLPQQVPVKSTELIRERLVPVPAPGDSSLLTALFACDSLNNVYLKQINEQKGKSVMSDVKFENNRMIYKTVYKHDTLYVPVRDTIRETEVPIMVPVEVNKLKWWQKALAWSGAAFLLYGAYLILNLIARVKSGSR